MTTNLEVKPVVKGLMRTREILEQDGWCQGSYTDRSGSHCLVGALRWAMPATMSRSVFGIGYLDACTLLRVATGVVNASFDAPLIKWNDEGGRTPEQVIAAVDRAIALGLGLP